MKKRIVFWLLCGVCAFGYSQKDVTVPETQSFDSGIGAQSSVNQSNGKLGIALSLVSLEGYKDLSASFGISYDGSQVVKNAKASNEYMPTGVLGLGWGMSFSQIMVDNKLTASRDDDTFYLFDGGGLNELIAVQQTTDFYEFKSKIHKLWKIRYFHNQEMWEVIKENGYKYTYDNVDWAIYWENWIGDSNQGNASRQGRGWNLTRVEDMHGNNVQYDYINVKRSLVNTGSIKHTEATYLKKVIGPSGEEIRLIYGNKTSHEYHQPNTAQAEPDAYQEIYERKYLKEVEVYDTNGGLMYTYKFDYHTVGSGEFRKRLLNKIRLVNASGGEQTFREFSYDEDSNSDFYGSLVHQILPTKGRVSYQYAVKEVEIDQVFETTSDANTSFIVQKDYILKLTGTNDLYLLTWTGTTWEEQLVHDFASGGVSGDYKNIAIVAKENFFGVVGPGGINEPYKVVLGGLEDNGKTWRISNTGTFEGDGSSVLELKVMAGDDFVAIGHPEIHRLALHRWDGSFWDTDYFNNSSNTGRFFYTAANNYVIQNKRQTGQDNINFYYYDLTNSLQVTTMNPGFQSTGGVCGGSATDPNCPANYWFGANSFAQVNANGNPEYLLHWDEDYNLLGTNAPFGMIPDYSPAYGVRNNYFATSEEPSGSSNHLTRYMGNGVWAYKEVTGASNSTTDHSFGLGHDAFANFYFGFNGFTKIHLFNANNATWQLTTPVQSSSGGSSAYDFFGGSYAFAYSKVYKIDSDLNVNETSYSFPSNTFRAKSDGINSLYISSFPAGFPSDFSRIIARQRDNTLFEYEFPENTQFIYGNPYKNYPTYVMGYGTYLIEDHDTGVVKIYKLIDDMLAFDSQGDAIYKDHVIVKETYDPVLTRKQRNYYCYQDPVMSRDNMRVYYGSVVQTNDLEAVLGKTLTEYDTGETDERRIGLPVRTRIYDSGDELVSEQNNTWRVSDLGNTYYINIDKRENITYEDGQEISAVQNFSYDLITGLQKETSVTDSEGNEETTETRYLFEEYPSVLDDNLISPVVYTRSYSQKGTDPKVYKTATAVTWDLSGVPVPGNSYSWDGTGGQPGTEYDFGGSNPDFRYSQTIDMVDSYGNVVQEKNRSEVVTSYVYGYDGKRLVARIQRGLYNDAIALVNMSIINNPSSDAVMRTELQKIRDGLPNAFVTTYTYNPAVGVTSTTDPRGRTETYVYDAFYRLDHVKDNEGNILRKNIYQYRNEPFVYSSEPTSLPDCTTMGIGIDVNGDPDPVTLMLAKISFSEHAATFEVSASNGNSYIYGWNVSVISSPSGATTDDFTLTQSGDQLLIQNSECVLATLSIQAYAVIGGETVFSGTLNHTFTNNECM